MALDLFSMEKFMIRILVCLGGIAHPSSARRSSAVNGR
jgi:hypothetical protein